MKHLLRRAGWLPNQDTDYDDDYDGGGAARRHETTSTPHTSCPCSVRRKPQLWMDWNASDVLLGKAPTLEKIPPGSVLLIDGNGLTFHLHSIAYTRYLRSLKVNDGGPHSSSNGQRCCPLTQDLSPDLIVKALPCMLPLSLLRQVTTEFITTLQTQNGGGGSGSQLEIQVLWDGPYRRFKERTDLERRERREIEESNLELFCRFGSLPKRKYACEWGDDFPYSRLFIRCVRHALTNTSTYPIQMIECIEEADMELAKRASGKQNTYVVGFDSDFVFYRDIQYIPLDKMCIQPSGLYAFCVRRSDLARALGVDDDQMVDLAMLMGNDYIDPSESLTLPTELQRWNIDSIVFYLQCRQDYRVTAKDSEEDKVLEFVRSLYNLEGNLDCLSPIKVEDKQSCRIGTPVVGPEDWSVGNALIRYLKKELEQNATDASFPLSMETFEVYKSMIEGADNDTNSQKLMLQSEIHRPRWEDVCAAIYIELSIVHLYTEVPPDALLIRVTPPDELMDRLLFHHLLSSIRKNSEHGTGQSSEVPDVECSLLDESSKPTVTRVTLPIDEHEEAILENIKNHRCTIIHGETGSGKSSRVPVMLLNAEAPDGSFRKVKFFISQPRRIAAKALVERLRSCEPQLRDKFALRMGHGWKEYETSQTQAYFVTAGYLVRLLANHPERFDDCTHLVIDEVHERSVDTDLLCLLCRRLMETNKHIRLVLMSATLATKLYRDYFNVPNEPIHVGVRPFPITEYFIEDLFNFGLPQKEVTAARSIQKENETKRCRSAPNSSELSNRFSLAARLTTIVGQPGGSVLIFVPGIAEIISISECIELIHKPGVRYTIYPIHSDIPFEEQMGAFDEPAEDEVKVIIATNAAESSVTLPSVDHVICLGLCRLITYNQASHRQILMPAWISRASATQRAGRTGRVRPGNVYRLYTRATFEHYMEEFEPGEMVRIPLDSVILMLKQILHEEVIPVFRDCLEPPSLQTIERSFQSLHRWNFISEPDDQADITSLGSFVSSLGVDLSFGSFIGLGIQFGVAAEAVEMAAMMSLPKTPFQTASPLWMSPGDFNKTASQTYVAKCKFDNGLYSEPMALMNAMWDYATVSNKNAWCIKNRIAIKRWHQVISTRNSLRKRVADFMGVNENRLQVQLPPRDMPHSKVNVLRILKAWVFSESIIECPPSSLKFSRVGSVSVSVKGTPLAKKITKSQLAEVLDSERHSHTIVETAEVEQTGVFDEEGAFSLEEHIEEMEKRFLSYMSEMNIEAALWSSSTIVFVYLDENETSESPVWNLLDQYGEGTRRFAYQYADAKRRGIQERPCGLWDIEDNPTPKGGSVKGQKSFRRVRIEGNALDNMGHFIATTTHRSNFESLIVWRFHPQGIGKKKKKKSTAPQPFSVTLKGSCNAISKSNMKDILGREVKTLSTNVKNSSQSIVFPKTPNGNTKERDCARPSLLLDVPEGCRVLALLASSQRKQPMLRFPRETMNDYIEGEVDEYRLKQEEVEIMRRWKRLDTGSQVFVEDSVPASAMNTASNLYAVAANALELQRGGLKVDCLTLFPANPLFVLLAFTSFGLSPSSPISWTSDEGHEEVKLHRLQKAFSWLVDRTNKALRKNKGAEKGILLIMESAEDGAISTVEWTREIIEERLEQAIAFNESSMGMGENLMCFPEKVAELCNLFDGCDGTTMTTWPSLTDESLTLENLRKWIHERKTQPYNQVHDSKAAADALLVVHGSSKSEDASNSKPKPRTSSWQKREKKTKRENGARESKDEGGTLVQANGSSEVETLPKQMESKRTTKKNRRKKANAEHHAIRTYDDETRNLSRRWFATDINEEEQVSKLPSTNILALLFQTFKDLVVDDVTGRSGSTTAQNDYLISLTPNNWEVQQFPQPDGTNLYQALFINTAIPDVPMAGRGKNKLPKWIRKSCRRPSTQSEALECVPPNIASPKCIESGGTLLFESIQHALQMEAAFWLDQQFCHAGKSSTQHWYLHSLDFMIHILLKVHGGTLGNRDVVGDIVAGSL